MRLMTDKRIETYQLETSHTPPMRIEVHSSNTNTIVDIYIRKGQQMVGPLTKAEIKELNKGLAQLLLRF